MNIIQRIVLYITSFIISLVPAPTYTEGVVGQPRTFLPHQAQSFNDKTISRLIYRGLFKHNIFGAAEPDLADTWTISEDGLVYTIKLKDNQRWTDGNKITSDDLIYTAYQTPDLTGVATDKVDELTVRFTLPNKYAPFLSLLTVPVMPVNAVERFNPLLPVSSGDFRVVRVGKRGSLINEIILSNNNLESEIKRLVFRYYSNEDELETAAKLGEIDGFLSNEPHELKNYTDYQFPLQGIYYGLFFNLREEKFEDLSLREKLVKTLPVEELISGKGIRVQGPISRSAFTDRDVSWEFYDEDFEDVLDIDPITITVPDMYRHKRFTDSIKDSWENNLNIIVNIKKADPEDFVEKIVEPRNFEVLFYGQEVGHDPDRYVFWHSTQSQNPGLNLTGFNQVRADRALEEGRNELDNEKRIIHYDEFQKVVHEEYPAVFLYHPLTHYYVSNYIENIGDKYTFTYADRFLDFEKWRLVHTN